MVSVALPMASSCNVADLQNTEGGVTSWIEMVIEVAAVSQSFASFTLMS